MKSLGSYSGERVIAAFKNDGWQSVRRKGSHVILEKDGHAATLSVPVHSGKTVKRGTLRSLIKDAGLSVREFLELA